MAQLKDTLIQGSARVTDTLYSNKLNITDTLYAPHLITQTISTDNEYSQITLQARSVRSARPEGSSNGQTMTFGLPGIYFASNTQGTTRYIQAKYGNMMSTILSLDSNNDISGLKKIVASPEISGTLKLTNTTDASGTANNSPALIVGGVATAAHLEFDANEIMAKASGTTVAPLYLNNDGGAVYIDGGYGTTSVSTAVDDSGLRVYARRAANKSVIDAYSGFAAASGTYSWGLNHLAPNIVAGANTCLLTGVANGTNNQGVLEFHYAGSNNDGNYVGLGLYGNNGLLKIYKNKTVEINSTLAASSDSLTVKVGTAGTTFTVAKFEGSAFLPGLTSGDRNIGSVALPWANIYGKNLYSSTGVTVTSGGVWIQGGSAAGSNDTRMALTSGMPDKLPYNSNKRGVFIYSNAIAFADPLNGNGNNDAGWIRHLEETANTGLLEIAVGDDNANEQVVVRRYNTSSVIAKEIKLFDTSGNSTFPGSITATNGFIGNATSATGVKDAGNTDRIITIRYSGSGAAATDWIPMHDNSGNLVPVSSTDLANKIRDKASGSWSITSTKANLLNSSATANTTGLQYYSAQPTIGSADGNAYAGSSSNSKLWSYPADYTAHTTVANIQTIRMYWDGSYWHDIFSSPNNEQLLHRSVLNGSAKGWRLILDSANYSSYALPLSGGTMTGTITLANTGLKTPNTAGFTTDQYGNFRHQSTSTSNTWELLTNAGAAKFLYTWETGDLSISGVLTATNGFIGNATSATRIKTSTVTTNDHSNATGYFLVYTWTIGAWTNYRMAFMVQSRHDGNGLIDIAVGNNSDTIDIDNMYAQIMYWGNTGAGAIIAADSWVIHGSSDGTKAYLFAKYNDYNESIITPLTDTQPEKSTWVTSLSTSTYGVQKAITQINVAADANNATKLKNARTLWGKSFNGTANITGDMTNVGPLMKLPSRQNEFSFLTSNGGAANAYFGRLGLNSSYANIDITNYVLDANGASRFGGKVTVNHATPTYAFSISNSEKASIEYNSTNHVLNFIVT